ncbi:MAG: rod-binding protein [Alphaproteobacteria bacterium]|nr:rod-binding protein [Alphaproteobacteria bacterium]MBL7098307.1 rod-binding protein [Alphaproteobacteria bacterium]
MSGPLPIDATTAMNAMRPAIPTVPKSSDPATIKKVAQQFEGVFISQFLGEMFSGIQTDGPFGGGQGEEMFRSLMIDEYGRQIATQGGFGLSAAIQREMLKMQETNVGSANAAH